MRFRLLLLALLLATVALFTLQNPDPATVRFWPWEFRASVALLALASATTGAVIALLAGWAARLRRRARERAESRAGTLPPPGDPRSPAAPSG